VSADTDGDGTPDFQDLDSDNDGIHDLVEGGTVDPAVVDENKDGVIDSIVDADGDGILDVVDAKDAGFGDPQTTVPADTDKDGTPDFQDLDSDNDGIHDLVEGGTVDPAVVDANKDGVIDSIIDADGDGIPDVADNTDNGFGDPQTTVTSDTDGDGTPDFQDLDSDNDGIHDLVEGGMVDPAVVDANKDGVVDSIVDADGDGIPDVVDTKDNGFGDPETTVATDTDGDGVPDYTDLDSDNDGIHDLVEGGGVDPAVVDKNNDGVIDPGTDTDGDGIPDIADQH
jgi:hypothetical protein